jgi:hypothetical protein
MLDFFPSSFVISSLHSSLCASKMPWMRKKSLRSNPKIFHLKPTSFQFLLRKEKNLEIRLNKDVPDSGKTPED